MAPNDEHHYDTHRYAGDQAADTRRAMNRMPDEDRSTRQEIQQSINASQAAELAPAVRMGDDRVIGNTPNWDSFSSAELHRFATQQNSPTTADDLGRAFNDGGNSLVEAANGLFDAVSRLDGAWSGVAAESAKAALAPLAQAAGAAGQTAQMMGVRMSQQSVAATEVRKLPPPKEFDSQQQLNAMVTGGPLAMQQDLKAQKDAADAVKREQISYLNTYTQALAAVDAQTPSFVPPQERIGGGGGNDNRASGGTVAIPGTGTGSTFRPRTTGAGPGSWTGGGDHGGGTGSGTGGTGTGGGDWTGGTGGRTDQHVVSPGHSTSSAGYNPTPAVNPTTYGPSGGTPATAGPGGGAGGFTGGIGGFGAPGSAGGAGGAAGGPAGGGAGSSANTGPRGITPSGMTPASAGRGNPAGVGGAPRGRSDGEEDREHERPSYLVEGDPESTFGSDQLTAPAVIGGDDD
jgi:hypothetical protein